MRIISGKFKGKFLHYIKNKTTRPLKDSVKENIFNILNHSEKFKTEIENSNILDLYSGIGSFGLECLSRGARMATFIEENSEVIKILKKNIIKLSCSHQSLVINKKVECINSISKKKKYNIIFLDPPYKKKYLNLDLKLIKQKEIFTKNHLIIIHREKKTDDDFGKNFQPIMIRKYGRSKIIFGNFI